MSGYEIRLSRTIHASRETVWSVLTDLEHAADTLDGISDVTVLTEGTYQVGTRWQETRTMFGKAMTEEMEVSEVDPFRRTVIEASSGGTRYRTTFELTSTGAAKTELSMVFDADTPESSGVRKVLGTVFGALGARATRKAMAQDLGDVARAAEAREPRV